MRIPWFGLALAATTGFLIVILFGPFVIRLLTKLKFGQTVRSDGPKTHQTKSGTPTMGGVLILFGITAGTIAGLRVTGPTICFGRSSSPWPMVV